MFTAHAYRARAKPLTALRAHDARVARAAARPQPLHAAAERAEAAGRDAVVGKGSARRLRVCCGSPRPRDPAQLAAFIHLRVANPAALQRRRGTEAAGVFTRPHGHSRIPFAHRAPSPGGPGDEVWTAALAGYPPGQWNADRRRAYREGRPASGASRRRRLGVVWSAPDAASDDPVTAAREWAAEHGHPLPRRDAAWHDHRLGEHRHNARAAGRRAIKREALVEQGVSVPRTGTWVLTGDQRAVFDDVEPSWCPVGWSTGWQRRFVPTHNHPQAGGEFPAAPGQVVVQGEDPGRWAAAQQRAWQTLVPAQRWLLEEALGIEPPAVPVESAIVVAGTGARVVKHGNRSSRWYRGRAGRRRGRSTSPPPGSTAGGRGISTCRGGAWRRSCSWWSPGTARTAAPRIGSRLGTFLDNSRSRKRAPERRAEFDALGMRWAKGSGRPAGATPIPVAEESGADQLAAPVRREGALASRGRIRAGEGWRRHAVGAGPGGSGVPACRRPRSAGHGVRWCRWIRTV